MMKFYSADINDFTTIQRKELEVLFIILNWTKGYCRKYPNHPIGEEWLTAVELTIMIIYEDALGALNNRGIAFHSGLDTTEAPPELICLVNEEIERRHHSLVVDSFIESSNNFNFGRPSTSSGTASSSSSEIVNFLYFGPASRSRRSNSYLQLNTSSSSNQSFVSAVGNSSGNSTVEDVPFNFQFPRSMHFNFGEERLNTYMNLMTPTSSNSFQSASALPDASSSSGNVQNSDEGNDSTPFDLTTSFGSSTISTDSDSSNPAIEFFRVSAGFIPPPENSEIAERQCTSPFCLCALVRAAYKKEHGEDSEDTEDVSDVEDRSEIGTEGSSEVDDNSTSSTVQDPIEPYLEVENRNFPYLELPDSLNDTHESYILLQPFNTPNDTGDLDTSDESALLDDSRETRFEPFNTSVSPVNTVEFSSFNECFIDSPEVDNFDGDFGKFSARSYSDDHDQEYIRRERERIVSSYEKSKLKQQKQNAKHENKADNGTTSRDENFATSSPNWRSYRRTDDDDDYRNQNY